MALRIDRMKITVTGTSTSVGAEGTRLGTCGNGGSEDLLVAITLFDDLCPVGAVEGACLVQKGAGLVTMVEHHVDVATDEGEEAIPRRFGCSEGGLGTRLEQAGAALDDRHQQVLLRIDVGVERRPLKTQLLARSRIDVPW